MSNNIKKIQIGSVRIAFVVTIFANCSSNKNHSNITSEEIREVKREISFPTLSASNQFILVKDSQFITRYKDFVIWQFPYLKEFSSNVFDKDGNVIEHKLNKVEPNVQRFIYKNGEQFGYYFDSLQDKTGAKHPVDSFLNDRFRVNENLLLSNNDSLLSRNSETEGVIKETYLRTKKTDKWDCDTNKLFFSDQFQDIPYSFSRKLDSSRGMKLFRIQQLSNGNQDSEIPFFRQRREVVIEIKHNPVQNRKEIIEFVNFIVSMPKD